MGRILKVFGIVVGALIVLFVAVLLAVGLLFDPNDYKDQITTAVADATGRALTLEGDLELSLFPRLRIALGGAELSNAPGFGDAPFARIDGATLQVGLLPLLSRRIEIDEARLRGLRLNLARDARGNNNWQDLAAGNDADADPDPDLDAGGDGAAIDLGIGAIEIADAEVSWSDGATGTEWLLTALTLEAADFGPDRAFPLSIEFDFSGPDIDVSIESEMSAEISLAENAYRLDNLDVTIDGEGAAWPGGGGRAGLTFDTFAANLDAQTVSLQGLTLEMLGLVIDGTLSGEQLFDNLTLTGGIEIHEFDPNDLLDAFALEIETADPDVFRRASARAEFIYDSTQMGMRNMDLRLDDSTLTGSLGLVRDALRFDLDVDRINIDRYLPPGEDTPSEDEGSIDEVDLPIDPLRDFVANGNLSLDEAQFLGMTFTNATFALVAGNGRMTLTPTGSLYGGSLNGEIGIAVQGDSARLSLRQNLTAVDLQGLGRDFLKTESLTGTGNVNLDVAATGSNVGAIRRDLDGTVSFALSDGAWEGIDAWFELRRAWNLVRRGPAPEREPGTPRTTFGRISGSGVVEDALLTTDDLNITLPFMAVTGGGTINLLTEEIDLNTTARFVDGPTLQSDPQMTELAGLQIRLPIGGTIGAPDPSYSGALTSLAGAILRRAASREVEEAREEARDQVQERIEEEREGLQDRVRDRLRGILQ